MRRAVASLVVLGVVLIGAVAVLLQRDVGARRAAASTAVATSPAPVTVPYREADWRPGRLACPSGRSVGSSAPSYESSSKEPAGDRTSQAALDRVERVAARILGGDGGKALHAATRQVRSLPGGTRWELMLFDDANAPIAMGAVVKLSESSYVLHGSSTCSP